jgi:hypothetical protein
MNKSIEKSLVNNGLKEDTSYLNAKDLDFGIIRTKSKSLMIRVRDYGAIDGDLIKATVIHNYKSTVLANKLYLESNFKDIKIDLQEGLNYLELQAKPRVFGRKHGFLFMTTKEICCCLTFGIILTPVLNLNLHL